MVKNKPVKLIKLKKKEGFIKRWRRILFNLFRRKDKDTRPVGYKFTQKPIITNDKWAQNLTKNNNKEIT